ncbi:hypothetical protein PRUPE_6G166300 [Prunus persica]|uniref:Uncharacterized protein n=1 Tax=Prunus persica TaxID=3760 RepID=A0A251NRN9_PRUPE|nr:hypothetical protein PRUPE_6G166300 [Prunus persica]
MLHKMPETCINKDIHPANESNLLTILDSPIKCQLTLTSAQFSQKATFIPRGTHCSIPTLYERNVHHGQSPKLQRPYQHYHSKSKR